MQQEPSSHMKEKGISSGKPGSGGLKNAILENKKKFWLWISLCNQNEYWGFQMHAKKKKKCDQLLSLDLM